MQVSLLFVGCIDDLERHSRHGSWLYIVLWLRWVVGQNVVMRTAVAPDIDVNAFEMTVETEEIETFATSPATFRLGTLETFGNDERSETGLNCPDRDPTMAAYLQDLVEMLDMT